MAFFRIVVFTILVALTAGCKEDLEILSEAKSWPTETISQLGGIKSHLKTSWRKGQLYYLYSVSPASEDIEDIKELNEAVKRSRVEDHYFTVSLYKGDLSIVELKVPFVSMTYIVNLEGITTKLERNSATSGVTPISWTVK